jgi:hypothetical protein
MKMREKKLDLLDLPLAERRRLCLEIRVALRERVAVGQIPVADDVIVADKTMWDAPDPKLANKENQKSSLLDSLMKRVL